MLVTLNLARDFRGRLYATGNPQACFELGTGQSEMTLRIPLGSQCGTVQQVSFSSLLLNYRIEPNGKRQSKLSKYLASNPLIHV